MPAEVAEGLRARERISDWSVNEFWIRSAAARGASVCTSKCACLPRRSNLLPAPRRQSRSTHRTWHYSVDVYKG